MQTLAAQCEPVLYLADTVADSAAPRWLTDARLPVLIGGRIAFSLAFFLGLYTVLYVAAAYKRFAKQVCRLAGGQTRRQP